MKRTLTNNSSLSSKVQPPSIESVVHAAKIPIESRTEEDNQVLFRHLLFNEELLKMMEKSSKVEQIAKDATFFAMKKGEVLFFEGADPDNWFIVLQGTLDVIIRLFLVAEDCLFDADAPGESTEFAPLMDQMGLDIANDKLRRVNVLGPNSIFGQHSMILNRKRMSTIVCSSAQCTLLRLSGSSFKTHALIHQQSVYHDHYVLSKSVLPRLREDQLSLISSLAWTIDIKEGSKISHDNSLGKYLYIVKKGTIARYQIVDFTPLSFRTLSAPFESLQIHFPSGFYPVHIDDLNAGALFPDPSIDEFSDSRFNVKTKTDVELLVFNLDYFRIIVGEFELERIKQEIRSNLTEKEVINIWIESEKGRLWKKFKERTVKEAKKSHKVESLSKTGMYGIRIPNNPKSIKAFMPRKIKPYAPKHLSQVKVYEDTN